MQSCTPLVRGDIDKNSFDTGCQTFTSDVNNVWVSISCSLWMWCN